MAEGDSATTLFKRKADELGIELRDLRTLDEEAEFIEICELPVNVQTKAKLRRIVREGQQPPVFRVSALVKGALRSNGARGNVYKGLEKHSGLYSLSEGKQVKYVGDDLDVKVYFQTYESATRFQSFLNEWELHKALLLLDGVDINPPDPEPINRPPDLTRFYLQHYDPQESESPCETLNQLASYRLSVPITEPLAPTDEVAIYQSIDVCVGTNLPYKCHLKDKARFKSVAQDPNNLLAASWPLHQMLDGLNNRDNMSVVKLSVVSKSPTPIAAQDGRFSVTLRLDFLNDIDANSFQARNGARRSDTKQWETVVYVRDPTKFEEFVEWKGNDTQSQWDLYNRKLEAST